MEHVPSGRLHMPHLSDPMRRYRALEEDLRLVRSERGRGSPQEDPILEEMANLWWRLSDIERETLDREGPTCDPIQLDNDDGLEFVDTSEGSLRARNS
jgi:hypothetical protein